MYNLADGQCTKTGGAKDGSEKISLLPSGDCVANSENRDFAWILKYQEDFSYKIFSFYQTPLMSDNLSDRWFIRPVGTNRFQLYHRDQKLCLTRNTTLKNFSLSTCNDSSAAQQFYFKPMSKIA